MVIDVLKSLDLATFEHPHDAEDALYHVDGTRYYGRQLEVEFARGDRKSKQTCSFRHCITHILTMFSGDVVLFSCLLSVIIT